ncbi:MAG: DUF418 domain-containing protein [Paludibacter sp.]|nr:DUF418 domain-containing protein [Paludibacter sp.]
MKEITRLHVVDALRGFAIVSIMLLHNIEHFDFYFFPENLPDWLKTIDAGIWKTMFFLFGGKSYAIFALLFGLTFYIQHERQAAKGKDFRFRFAWRLLLLFVFGTINSAFYEGDILSIYAILGLTLIPVARLNDKIVFIISILLLLQPVGLYDVFWGIMHPHAVLPEPASWSLFAKAGEYIPQHSFLDTVVGNLTNGKKAVALWSWESGRVFQTPALFMLGMLAGRRALFEDTNVSKTFWNRTLVISGLAFIALYFCQNRLESWIPSVSIHVPLKNVVITWSNFAFMLVLISGFFISYHTRILHKVFDVFSPLGQMSLSNYIMQSMLGSIIYYGFGLGLYEFTGASHCLMIGLILAIIQGIFSKWWLNSHKRGPLEQIWHRLTWVGAKR